MPVGAIDFVSTASLAFRLLAIHNVEIEHSMQLRILQLSPDLSTKHVHLLLRITQLTRKQRVPESLEAFLDLQVVPGSDFFLCFFTAASALVTGKYPNKTNRGVMCMV